MGDRKKTVDEMGCQITSWNNIKVWSTPGKPSAIDRLKRALSFGIQKKEDAASTSSKSEKKKPTKRNKPMQWEEDTNRLVRAEMCSFHVKYLGAIEVKESRGIDVCEQAVQALLNQKGKHIKAILHISGDALRIVDETNKCLLVDQTIEKVSFCAPDRRHEKGFAYISRDGVTRRWLCHGFLAIKESGERLSHAVGCTFEICLKKKQKRDHDCNVTVQCTPKGTSFTRFGSYRTSSITERMIDPQIGIVADPIPSTPSNHTSNAIERPRPKGKNSDAFNRSLSICTTDRDRTARNGFKWQSSMTPSDSPLIEGMKYKNSLTDTILEEVGISSIISELPQSALFDSTNQTHHSLPPGKPSTIPLSNNENTASDFSFTNSPSTTPKQLPPTMPINDALAQINHPTNPFSPYGYSTAAHAHFRQSNIITSKRGTNPFDDDLVRR